MHIYVYHVIKSISPDALNGAISCQSTEGLGTSMLFSFTQPISPEYNQKSVKDVLSRRAKRFKSRREARLQNCNFQSLEKIYEVSAEQRECVSSESEDVED